MLCHVHELVLLQGLAELLEFNLHYYPDLFKSQKKTAKPTRKQAPTKSTPVLSVRTVHPLCLPCQTLKCHPAVLLPYVNTLQNLIMDLRLLSSYLFHVCMELMHLGQLVAAGSYPLNDHGDSSLARSLMHSPTHHSPTHPLTHPLTD